MMIEASEFLFFLPARLFPKRIVLGNLRCFVQAKRLLSLLMSEMSLVNATQTWFRLALGILLMIDPFLEKSRSFSSSRRLSFGCVASEGTFGTRDDLIFLLFRPVGFEQFWQSNMMPNCVWSHINRSISIFLLPDTISPWPLSSSFNVTTVHRSSSDSESI